MLILVNKHVRGWVHISENESRHSQKKFFKIHTKKKFIAKEQYIKKFDLDGWWWCSHALKKKIYIKKVATSIKTPTVCLSLTHFVKIIVVPFFYSRIVREQFNNKTRDFNVHLCKAQTKRPTDDDDENDEKSFAVFFCSRWVGKEVMENFYGILSYFCWRYCVLKMKKNSTKNAWLSRP